MDVVEVVSVSNDHVRPCRSCDDRSGKLGRHSPGAYIASCGGFAKLTHIVIHVFYNVDKLCIRIGIGIVCKKTVNIGHEDQKIRIDQCSNHRGKGIVVSEFYQVLEFVGGYRVVLIYNGDHLFCQKLLEGILGIPAVSIVDHGILGHQDLCHHLIVFPEKLLINGHQPGLSHSCTGLLFLKLCRLSLHTQCSCTYRNGSGGYQHYVFPLVMKVAELSGQDLQLTEIQSSCFCVDQ